jgi:hypothetical protein
MYVFSFNTILAKNKIFLDSIIFLLPCAFLGSYNLSKIFALVPTVFIIFASALLDDLAGRVLVFRKSRNWDPSICFPITS